MAVRLFSVWILKVWRALQNLKGSLQLKLEQLLSFLKLSNSIIGNRRDWLWSPANIKGVNKDAKICVGRSTTLHNLLFHAHTLCMSYVTNAFLLVSSSVRSKQLLCFVYRQGPKREQRHTTKNFVEFNNHSPLLTMFKDTTFESAFSTFYCLISLIAILKGTVGA